MKKNTGSKLNNGFTGEITAVPISSDNIQTSVCYTIPIPLSVCFGENLLDILFAYTDIDFSKETLLIKCFVSSKNDCRTIEFWYVISQEDHPPINYIFTMSEKEPNPKTELTDLMSAGITEIINNPDILLNALVTSNEKEN